MGPLTRPSPILAALEGLCPRCGARTLFRGLVDFAPSCRACQLDFASFSVTDRPAALLMLIVVVLITAVALAFDEAAAPPILVHVLLWVPITALAVLGCVRVMRGLLLGVQYRKDARAGRVVGER